MKYEELLTWATGKQVKYIRAVIEHGSEAAAARALSLHKSTVNNSVAAVRKKAAAAQQVSEQDIRESMRAVRVKASIKGFSPEHNWTRPVPDTHNAARVSTFYDKDGKARNQWVIGTLDQLRAQEAKDAAYAAMAAELPRLEPIKAPELVRAELCNLYVMTDCHMGMLAWHREGGDDWDVKIAERTLSECFEAMVLASPQADVGIVANLGDFLHYDGMKAVTPEHGHVLDTDTRFPKVVESTVRVLRRLVDRALERHRQVVVLMGEGNHDPSASVWLRTMFAALYENEPRAHVIVDPLPYYAYQHGSTFLGFHHGHLKKADSLPLLLAAKFPQQWGQTNKRYCHTGHWHHAYEREHPGMLVIQHPTLAAADSFTARSGYLSQRQATAMTFHCTSGLVARNTVTPEMMEMAA